MASDAVSVSAPGKVLLAGGYLVLDRQYNGLVFGLDARIHVIVQDMPTSSGVTLQEITVKSPQFEGAVWSYGYHLGEKDGGIEVTQLRADADFKLNRNPFVETALSYVLSYIYTITGANLGAASITILADNSYYTTPSETSGKGRFHDFGVPLSGAHKTGLGSSAALVTAFTGAILSYYLSKEHFDISTEAHRRLLHNLSQASHSAAQGKVGSGFDVASAVYGSCLYRRFSPGLLSSLSRPGVRGFGTQLRQLVEETEGTSWDMEVLRREVRIPKGVRLVMCDVEGGSQTPGLVRTMLKWRETEAEAANGIWGRLDEANGGLVAELRSCDGDDTRKLRDAVGNVRSTVREMSEASGVPVEPQAQTELLNACEEIDGVIGGVVPGAGGYDAIALLIRDDEKTVAELTKLFAGWKLKNEQGESDGKVRMLGVREEMEGVKIEAVDAYKDWLE